MYATGTVGQWQWLANEEAMGELELLLVASADSLARVCLTMPGTIKDN